MNKQKPRKKNHMDCEASAPPRKFLILEQVRLGAWAVEIIKKL